MRRTFVHGVTVLLVMAGSCVRAEGSRRLYDSGSLGGTAPSFDEAFAVVDTVVLEERAGVITVHPLMYFDPLGGFLVVEPRESQVRVYTEDGRLVQVIGDPNAGGVQLPRVAGAARLTNGSLAVTTSRGELMIFPHGGNQPTARTRTPLQPVFGLVALDSARLLIMGKDRFYTRSLLHVWSVAHEGPVTSFLHPPRHLDSTLVNTIAHAEVTVRGEQIAALHQLDETLYLFDGSGNLTRQARVRVDGFVPPSGPLPNLERPSVRKAWVDEVTFLVDLHWYDDTTLVIQAGRGSGSRAEYSLTKVDTYGRRVAVTRATPRLLGIRDGRYFFHAGGPHAPNIVLVAVEAKQVHRE